MESFLQALALALVFEGIAFALFPETVRKALLEAAGLPGSSLRALGGAALSFALILIFLLRLMK